MKRYEHLGVGDSNRIRDIFSQKKHTSDAYEIVKENKVILLKTETIGFKNDSELDEALRETFPASDAIAKYV